MRTPPQQVVGPTITVHAPFDSFATDVLGIFNRTEDNVTVGGQVIPAPPLMVRRSN